MESDNGKTGLNTETEFLNVLDRIYAAALDEDLWPGTLDSIANLLGAVSATAELIDLKKGRPIYVDFGERLSAEIQNSYQAHFGDVNPRVADGMGQPVGAIRYDYAFLSEADIGLNEFYADFVGPQDLKYFVSGHILGSASHAGLFAAQRSSSQGHVGEEEIGLVRRLIPHMRQAFDMRIRLAKTGRHNQGFLHGLADLGEPTFLVDHSGRVLYENQAAADLLSTNDGVTAAARRLDFADRTASARFAGALESLGRRDGQEIDMESRNFTARRPSGERPYIISVRALPAADAFAEAILGAAAILFIRDPAHFAMLDTDLLRQSYGLTEAESDLALALDSGAALPTIAERRGVSITTIRTQLYSLMAKLDVNRQTDLVRLLRQYRKPF